MKNRKKQDNAAAQSAIYVGFVDTPGLFASIIRRVIGQNYVHVVLGFDPELKEAYSIGRRNPAIPLFAGFERENREKILKKYPTARYQVCRVACTYVQRGSAAAGGKDGMGTTLYPSLYGDRAFVFVSWNRL